MKTNCRRLSFLVIGLLLSVVGTTNAAPLGTAFTYQGRLADGTNAANNLYDLDFALFEAPTGGSQLGLSVTYSGYPVSNGLFTVALDFGASPFNGDARWLRSRCAQRRTHHSLHAFNPTPGLNACALRALFPERGHRLRHGCRCGE